MSEILKIVKDGGRVKSFDVQNSLWVDGYSTQFSLL
jgi:hypothetical protein